MGFGGQILVSMLIHHFTCWAISLAQHVGAPPVEPRHTQTWKSDIYQGCLHLGHVMHPLKEVRAVTSTHGNQERSNSFTYQVELRWCCFLDMRYEESLIQMQVPLRRNHTHKNYALEEKKKRYISPET